MMRFSVRAGRATEDLRERALQPSTRFQRLARVHLKQPRLPSRFSPAWERNGTRAAARFHPERKTHRKVRDRESHVTPQPGRRLRGFAARMAEEMDPEDVEEVAAELRGKKIDGWSLLQLAAGSGLTAYLVWAGILMPGFRKVPLKLQVPYIPASAKQVENVMMLLKGRSGKIVDLGSGDGRIVLEAYKQGFRPAVGYELNPWLLQISRYRTWKVGCYGKVSYYRKDLWKANLSDCQNITVFLAPSVLSLLEEKLFMELPDEARVVTGCFPLPSWTPTSTAGEGVNQAWAYDVTIVRQAEKEKAEGSPV